MHYKNKISHPLLFTIYFLFLPVFVFAQVGITPVNPVSPTDLNFNRIITSAAAWATGLLLILAVLFVLYAAYLFLTSGGSEDEVKNAKKYIVYSAVAIAVALLANAVVAIVRQLIIGV